MSYISPRPEQSSDTEITLLNGLGNLPVSGSNQFIRKTSASTFSNASVTPAMIFPTGFPTNRILFGDNTSTPASDADLTYDPSTDTLNVKTLFPTVDLKTNRDTISESVLLNTRDLFQSYVSVAGLGAATGVGLTVTFPAGTYSTYYANVNGKRVVSLGGTVTVAASSCGMIYINDAGQLISSTNNAGPCADCGLGTPPANAIPVVRWQTSGVAVTGLLTQACVTTAALYFESDAVYSSSAKQYGLHFNYDSSGGTQLLSYNNVFIGTKATNQEIVVVHHDNDGSISGMLIRKGVNYTTVPTAMLHVVDTTEQLRIAYNATNYFKATVSSSGVTTFEPAGASANFVFNSNLTINGELHVGAGFFDSFGSSGATDDALYSTGSNGTYWAARVQAAGSDYDIQIKLSGALSALTPSSGYLNWNGSSYSWSTPSGTAPAGSSGDLQYNNGGVFGNITSATGFFIYNAGYNWQTFGYTGSLKDSTSTVIADLQNGLITAVYF